MYGKDILITPRRNRPHHAVLRFGLHRARCAIGGAGATEDKKEGDGATPTGRFALRRLWYRPDRFKPPQNTFPMGIIAPKSGWCDAPKADAYNRPITRPFAASHERLWRRDHLYDVFFELGYNDDPVMKDRGSAIFLHLQKNNFQPTLGCIAVAMPTMIFLIKNARPGCHIEISKKA